jgi:hypothetical protein
MLENSSAMLNVGLLYESDADVTEDMGKSDDFYQSNLNYAILFNELFSSLQRKWKLFHSKLTKSNRFLSLISRI